MEPFTLLPDEPHLADKLMLAFTKLGVPTADFKCDGSNRDTVRSALNGMGFPYAVYNKTTCAELQAAWISLFDTGDDFDDRGGLGLGLVPIIAKAGETNPDRVAGIITVGIRRLDERLMGVPTADYPDAEEVAAVLDALPQPDPSPAPAEDAPVVPAQAAPNTLEAAKALLQFVESMTPKAADLDEGRVIELIQRHARATEIRLIRLEGERTVPTGLFHRVLPDVIKMLSAGVNVMMVGPAGSGKTTIAAQASEALGLPFFFNGALNSEYKLTGFVDAQGRIVSTAFRKAYETGGVYLFDEIDASMPDALLAFNAALSNGHADFPDGSVSRHEKFHCIAAANTFGRGADRVYVGRNQLDGASLDRFCVINVDYDEDLERALASNDNWTSYVQKVRKAVFDLKIRHVVSPRASIAGANMLAAGLERVFVEEAALFKGMDRDTLGKIKAAAGV